MEVESMRLFASALAIGIYALVVALMIKFVYRSFILGCWIWVGTNPK